MINKILAILPDADSAAAAVTHAIDSTKTAILDTTGRSAVEKTVIETIDNVTNASGGQLAAVLMDKALMLGLKVLAALAIYIIGGYAIRFVKKFVSRLLSGKHVDAAIASFTLSLVSALLWVLLIILTIGALGVETTSLAALLAAGGMAIGMALSGTVQNFAGGIMIIAFKPFKVGDLIEAQGYLGTVSEVSITSTKLVTLDNRVVILPNGPLSGGSVDNYSKMDFRRVDWTFSVEYGSDAKAVKELLLSILGEDSRVLDAAKGAPADPFVAVSQLGPSGVDFVVRVWVNSADYWGVYFDTNEKVYTTLPEKGIFFPFPQMTVHMDK